MHLRTEGLPRWTPVLFPEESGSYNSKGVGEGTYVCVCL